MQIVMSDWWWLSFADDGGFRGVVVAEGPDFLSAIRHVHELGISPGGQVRGVPIPATHIVAIAAGDRNRILSAEDCARYGPKADI